MTKLGGGSRKSSHNKPVVPQTVSLDGPEKKTGKDGKQPLVKSQQIKLTLKSLPSAAKPAVSKSVLEKLGETDPSASRKRKASTEGSGGSAEKKKAPSSSSSSDKKKEKKTTADRREELLKQLKAVENAIAKKRTKV